VRTSEQAVAAYKSANNIVDVTQGNRLVNRQVEDLTQQLALARSRTADARARLERLQRGAGRTDDPAALSESLQSQVIANLRSQYTEAARLEAEYSALYGSRYPGLVAIRAQLSDIRRQIDNEIGRIQIAVRNEYQMALGNESSLESELTKLKAQSASFTDANVKLHELEREAQANRVLFEQFLNRAKETTEQQSLQIADARIVSPALIPLKPDRPPLPLLLIAAAICGIILGVGLVLLLERARRGFRSVEEVEGALSLPVLGVFPHADVVAAGRARRTPADEGRLAATRPDELTAASEATLRAIRMRLRQGRMPQSGDTLIVLSALPGEGKSTLARNYALACARAGTKTLLIDGDVYTRSVTQGFGIAGPGLCEVLDGETTLWAAMRKEPKSGLHIMGARSAERNPKAVETIAGAELESLLHTCRKHFDAIVIDSPAILPTSGLVPFVKSADRALLIVEWERTERQAVADALDLLGADAGRISAVVLNKVAMRWYRFFDRGRYLYAYDQYMTIAPDAPVAAVPLKKAG
jgi:capsular exopolysaccharide synthesis family protein